jgi:L-lactate dehydrogenase complex protein LldG
VEREAFLARVRTATEAAHLPPHPSVDPGLLVPDLGDVDLITLFVSRCEEAEAIVHRPAGRGDVPQLLVDIARNHGATSFVSWDDDFLPVIGGAAALRAAGLDRVSGVVPDGRRFDHQMGYLELSLGLTGAEAGLAESGTIVLRSGIGRPRMASLVPLTHVALLRSDRIHRSLSHWAVEEARTIPDAANVVFITGPSKTGDIEQNINVGVHGPRYVHVVLIDP